MEGNIPRITLKRSQSSHANSWKLIAIRNLRWLNSRPVTLKYATLYFYLLPWEFFSCFSSKILILFVSFLDEYRISATEYYPIRNQNT